MIQAFKQINMSWSIKPIDRYEWDFDKNRNGKMDDQEYYYILAEYLWIEQDSLRKLRVLSRSCENPLLYNKTSTMFLYSPLGTDEKDNKLMAPSDSKQFMVLQVVPINITNAPSPTKMATG
ncbi:MAG: hypothetical protein IPN20_00570 [Haliscomenobacter sp.]|nr:hypothetical protein [Haliscomenobacter sp.]